VLFEEVVACIEYLPGAPVAVELV